MLPWSELKSLKIDEKGGQVEISKQGKLVPWAILKLEDIPNVEVLRMLVQHITGVLPEIESF